MDERVGKGWHAVNIATIPTNMKRAQLRRMTHACPRYARNAAVGLNSSARLPLGESSSPSSRSPSEGARCSGGAEERCASYCEYSSMLRCEQQAARSRGRPEHTVSPATRGQRVYSGGWRLVPWDCKTWRQPGFNTRKRRQLTHSNREGWCRAPATLTWVLCGTELR